MAVLFDERGRVILNNLEVADSFFSRLKGLLGRKTIEKNFGMLLLPCGSVHMFFMKFSIDVFFLRGKEKSFEVLKIVRNLKPWRVALAPPGTTAVLESAPGAIKGMLPGSVLRIGG